MKKFISIILIFSLKSCALSPNAATIAEQKAEIDSLKIELRDYKILHAMAKIEIEVRKQQDKMRGKI